MALLPVVVRRAILPEINRHTPPRKQPTTMNIPEASASTAAPKGRERICAQCTTAYRAPRSSSLYCTPACRKKANRGTAPTISPKAGVAGFSVITKALSLTGYVGRVSGGKTAPIHALLVPYETAFDELAYQFNRKGWGFVTRDEFAAALRCDGIQGFATRSPEAATEKRWQDRQRLREKRAA